RDKYGDFDQQQKHESLSWYADSENAFLAKAESESVGVLSTENPDIRSLRELLTYGIKGIAAYVHHAMVLNFVDPEISTERNNRKPLSFRSSCASIF
ncbi:MAG: hypothetical protein HQL93_11170, partial [Magnetococcales bacterium]|nr:hypothetical protein [Magnetococcales bacterium]